MGLAKPSQLLAAAAYDDNHLLLVSEGHFADGIHCLHKPLYQIQHGVSELTLTVVLRAASSNRSLQFPPIMLSQLMPKLEDVT